MLLAWPWRTNIPTPYGKMTKRYPMRTPFILLTGHLFWDGGSTIYVRSFPFGSSWSNLKTQAAKLQQRWGDRTCTNAAEVVQLHAFLSEKTKRMSFLTMFLPWVWFAQRCPSEQRNETTVESTDEKVRYTDVSHPTRLKNHYRHNPTRKKN